MCLKKPMTNNPMTNNPAANNPITTPPAALDQRPLTGPYSGLTINSARRFISKQFEQAGLAACDGEARELLMAATGLSREELITMGTELMTSESFDLLQQYAARRLAGEPVDNILGWREFYGRRFKVCPDVLSPRQETEEVVAKALEMIKSIDAPRIVDLGTGSGAIIAALLLERPKAIGTAIDISEAALSIAASNAKTHKINERLTLLRSHWLTNLQGQFDLIISNPPYIDSNAMAQLSPEVINFDPAISLHGGTDGLEAYRIIAAQAGAYLKPNGALVFEIGYDQGQSVPDILRRHNFKDINVFNDLAGLARIVTALRE